MDRLKRLLREIHRRSVWQVLGVFLATSWGVLNAVDVLTGFAGLPDWTPTMALVLLLIGLPVVVATAVVQEGMPGESMRSEPGAEDASGDGPGTPADGEVDPHQGGPQQTQAGGTSSGRGAVRRVFTWRNAILGGALAGLLLTVSAGAYMLMWATGIGPVGSLVAQGVLEERDPIVVATFESRADEELGTIVAEALAVDLSQSPTVTLLGRDAVQSALTRMGRDPSEPVTEAVAREVAVRENLKAFVAGEVSRVGTRYLLVARIVSAETGEDLVSFREEAAGDDDLLPAIDRLSARLREKMGESLKTIRRGTPLEVATTPSLEALRKLSQAELAEERGEYERALELLGEAVALDPGFAQAYRKISVLHFNVGRNREAMQAAATAAYQNRDRLTERERYLVEANYHNTVAGDKDAVVRAYRSVLEIDPDDSAALNNLSNIFRERGDDEQALRLLERAVAGPGRSSVSVINVVWASLNLGDLEGARAARERYRELYPNHIFQHLADFELAAFEGDRASIHAWADSLERDPNSGVMHADLPRIRIAADVATGQVREALAHGNEIDQVVLAPLVRIANAPLGEADVRLWILADSTGARAATRRVMDRLDLWSRPVGDRGWEWPVRTLALAGDVDGARAMLARWLGGRDRSAAHPASLAIAESMIALAEGRADDALTSIEAAADALRCSICVLPERALIYEALDRPADAIAEWERSRRAPVEVATAEWERTVAIKRLGPLYEAVGETSKAVEAYAALVDAWADGDPEVQPQVDRARARIEALSGDVRATPG